MMNGETEVRTERRTGKLGNTLIDYTSPPYHDVHSFKRHQDTAGAKLDMLSSDSTRHTTQHPAQHSTQHNTAYNHPVTSTAPPRLASLLARKAAALYRS
ncbi:hypothetical protein E2C01_078081 [Portunus trituberculatus]|uniref:Uncharacterized protein n=1 Tax=Portunus trituberculatus TaxID=210409 RepID=A0A5B7IHT2_PORTR|nr:hypothetical protein [Portunus trituberculatus]